MKITYTPTHYQQEENIKRLPYFSLKGDQDSAYVRFMDDSLESLDIQRVHPIEFVSSQGKKLYPNVACIRESLSDVNDTSCPFCNAQFKAQNYVYVKLLKYENGEITPCIWQKPWGFINDLRTIMNDYGENGNIKNSIFKITRNGAKGDKSTKYVISYMPKQTECAEQFPIPSNAFDDFDSSLACVWNKNANEMESYVNTGSFAISAPAVDRFDSIKNSSSTDSSELSEETDFASAPVTQIENNPTVVTEEATTQQSVNKEPVSGVPNTQFTPNIPSVNNTGRVSSFPWERNSNTVTRNN